MTRAGDHAGIAPEDGGMAAAVLPNLLLARAAAEPGRTIIEEVGGERATYRSLADAARRWAGVLSDLGVAAGDTVLVMQPTSIDAYAVWIGIALLGAIEVPVNTQLRGPLLGYVLDDSQASVAVAAQRHVDALLDAAATGSSLETIVVSDADDAPHATAGQPRAPGLLAGRALRDARAPLAAIVTAQPWEIATILYTSGTTGPSKGVMVPWGQLLASTLGSGPERTLRQPHTAYYAPYPSFHVSGKTPLYAMALGRGRLVIRERFSTSGFWSDIRAHGCTYTSLIGATASFVFRQPPRAEDADNPLEAILFSPWTADVEAFRARFGVEAYSVFNMTEASCPIVGGWDGGPIADPCSCGHVREGYELRIVDEHDLDVAPGQPGELLIRAREPWTLMAGYWRKPEQTVAAWRNQWLHTGDLFRCDDAGNYFYVDRLKDAIRRRGENISSAEVEAQVLEHPDVFEAAAIAVPDEVSGEEVKVVVTARPPGTLDAGELAQFLADHLPAFMVPRYVEVVAQLPKTATEKIRKAQLREAGVTAATWDRQRETHGASGGAA